MYSFDSLENCFDAPIAACSKSNHSSILLHINITISKEYPHFFGLRDKPSDHKASDPNSGIMPAGGGSPPEPSNLLLVLVAEDNMAIAAEPEPRHALLIGEQHEPLVAGVEG
jgi:hypothetical protein